ncbi:Dabb family protein [Priestia megaterium]|uniref:Dabb family protein n=1 Tax=Priestia megaterium TaxID=1404 RepID=UPI0031707FE2
MIRHIFIAPIKEGITEEKLNKEINLLKAMKDNIPEIMDLTIGKNTGWVGGENAVTMVVDLKDKEAFEAYMVHPYHVFINSINGTEDDCFVTSELYSAQIECEK